MELKKDHVMLRLSCILRPQWLQAYALVDLVPGIDPLEFRFEIANRLNKFHEVENYLGGTPGDLFIGFFAEGQGDLLREIGKIKAMKEIREMKEWAIANFPVGRFELIREDWLILKYLRGGKVTQELASWFKPDPAAMMRAAQGHPLPSVPMDKIEEIAGALKLSPGKVLERLEFMKAIPKGVMLQVPDESAWNFTEIHYSFQNTTFEEKVSELMKYGMPFGAESHSRQGAIMAQPESVEDLRKIIKNISMIPGVRVCDFAFCEDILWTQPWLDDFIEERIK